MRVKDGIIEKAVLRTYKDDDAKPTGWEQQVHPGLNLVMLNVVSRGDNTSLVQTSIQLYNNLS